jgi:F-type H+-transporting ATPase subunit delta
MAELTTLARPYAKAAFQAAQQSGKLAEWAGMLNLLSQISADASLKALLAHPGLSVDAKAKALIEIAGDNLSVDVCNFVKVLSDNKRLPLLPQIAELFEKLKAQQEKTIDVVVETAFEISDAEKTNLANALSKKLARHVNLTTLANPGLIGGVVVRAEDLVIDASVKGKLARLAESMNS